MTAPNGEKKYPAGSLGWMNPEFAAMVEQLLAERNVLEARLAAVYKALTMGGQNADIRCRAAIKAWDGAS